MRYRNRRTGGHLREQRLLKPLGISTFGLFTCIENGVRKFLVKCRAEIGSFDKIEIGPTVQADCVSSEDDAVIRLFDLKMKNNEGVLYDTLMSEEGGRFYHEQNRNIYDKY